MRSDGAGPAEVPRVVLQIFVHLVARDTDLVKIMRVVANGTLIPVVALVVAAVIPFMIPLVVTLMIAAMVVIVVFALVAFNVRR